MTIGIVVSHPDDEAFGMGGTIVKLAKDNLVALLVLADGVSSRTTSTTQDRVARNQAASAAAEVLGIKQIECLGLPDQRLDTLPFLDIVQMVECWLARIKPGVLYTHSVADLNYDHRITYDAVITATRPTQGHCVKKVYGFEVPSSTEWNFGKPSFSANSFVDITDTWPDKMRALQCYEAEMRTWPHPRSPMALEIRAQYWGQVVGVHYAEAFQLIRGLI